MEVSLVEVTSSNPLLCNYPARLSFIHKAYTPLFNLCLFMLVWPPYKSNKLRKKKMTLNVITACIISRLWVIQINFLSAASR